MNLPICYKLKIAPVEGFLKGPALTADKSGKFLSETFRIRIVPSLTTLHLIDESPADYHCHTGALIVGNPDVGEVHFKGKLTKISQLQCAEHEAWMVAK